MNCIIDCHVYLCNRYPVNRLRQAALDRCPGAIFISSRRLVVVFCTHTALLNCAAGHWIFFAIDVDFVPSANLYASLAANSEWLTSVAPSGLLSDWFAN